MPRGIPRLSVDKCRATIKRHVEGLNTACKDMRKLGYNVNVHEKSSRSLGGSRHEEVMVLVSEAYNGYTTPLVETPLVEGDTKSPKTYD